MSKEKDIDGTNESGRISLIAVIGAKTRALGKNGKLLWRLPGEQEYFKNKTLGHPVIMGRKTWESLPESVRPLPERTNIVVSRQAGYSAQGASVVPSLEEAFAFAKNAPGKDEVFVIGGGELYTLALPHADRLYLTLVENEPEADTFFPSYEKDFSSSFSEGEGLENDVAYRHCVFERI